MNRITDSLEDWLPRQPRPEAVKIAKASLLNEHRESIMDLLPPRGPERKFIRSVPPQKMNIWLGTEFNDADKELHAYISFNAGRATRKEKDFTSTFNRTVTINPPASDGILDMTEPVDIIPLAADLVHGFRTRLYRWVRHNICQDDNADFEEESSSSFEVRQILTMNFARLKEAYERIMDHSFGIH